MKFRAHETFAIRKGWLGKGLRNVDKEPEVFVSKTDNPMDVLGIGANMVKALRYYLQATGLTEEPLSGKRAQTMTEIGRIIYENDPYFEEIGSLWLVHYALSSNEENATSWYVFFNEFSMNEFSEDDFYKALRKYVRIIDNEKMPSSRVISDDFKCVINTYCASKRSSESVDPENNLECPLTELGLVDLVTTIHGNRIYRKTTPKYEDLPMLIILAVILCKYKGEKEIRISSLLNDKCSIGNTFNIDTLSLMNILYDLEKNDYIKVIRTAGLDIIKILTDMSFEECIREYYYKLGKNGG